MTMLSKRIQPISYLKSHAAEIIRNLSVVREPLIITQNGQARGVLIDIDTWEQTQETMALLRILALGERQAADGRVSDAFDAIAELRRAQTKE